MGWRDRVKKSFGDSEHIVEGIQNSKKIEKERKDDLKTTFIYYPHNPQNPQNRKNGDSEADTPRPVKTKTNTGRPPARNIPAPTPPGLGLKYAGLWNRAWCLADEIDDVTGAPIEERRARLPELEQMILELTRLEKRGARTPGHEIQPPTPDRPPDQQDPDYCPAKCKTTGKCYGRSVFIGKTGKLEECTTPCRYEKERQLS